MSESKPFSPRNYLFLVFVQCLAMLGLMQILALYFFDYNFIVEQTSYGWQAFLAVFLGSSLGLGLFEWLFHRYVLHCVVFRSLQKFAKAHRQHHKLTPRKKYPIIEPEQHESQAFPWFALPAFWAFFSLLLWPLHFLFQGPFLLAGGAAVTFSLTLYEIIHDLEHETPDWWEKHIGWLVGQNWKILYNYHHVHHANVKCNENISGFFGFPLWDLIFGTFYVTDRLTPTGETLPGEHLVPPQPRRFIQWLDKLALERERNLRIRNLVSA